MPSPITADIIKEAIKSGKLYSKYITISNIMLVGGTIRILRSIFIHPRLYQSPDPHPDEEIKELVEPPLGSSAFLESGAGRPDFHVRKLLRLLLDLYGAEVKEAYLRNSFPLTVKREIGSVIDRFVTRRSGINTSDISDDGGVSVYPRSAIRLGSNADSVLVCDYVLRGQLPGTDGPYSCGIYKDFVQTLNPEPGVESSFIWRAIFKAGTPPNVVRIWRDEFTQVLLRFV